MKSKPFLSTLIGIMPILLMAASTVFISVPSSHKLLPTVDETNPDKTLSPYFFIKSDNPNLDQMPLKATSAEVNIAGVIADVSVIQEYANEGKSPIEAIYIFPASTRAAVYSMKMTIGKRTIEAKITEHQKARQDFEAARQQGKSASLLEQQRPNVFQMNVANIMPGDKIKVELRYTELLIPDNGIYEFVYPTVVGPRYSNKAAAGASPNDKWVSNPYTREGEKPLYSFNLKCSIAAGMQLSDVKCNTHKTTVNFDSPSDALITLASDETQGGNRDFILQYRLAGNKVQSGLLLYPGKDENFFLAMIQPPKQVRLSVIPPREYVFIVDVSGSMHGFPLDISKKLLRDLIGNLRPNDKFNVILFAGVSNLLSETSLTANEENVDRAISFIDKENGGGGTELLPALKRALSLKGIDGYARSFVIATDGYVDVEKASFDLIRQNLDKASFFSLGIGSSVNRYIIEGIAHVGMGMPFVITKPEEAKATAEKFRQYVLNPVLTHINVSFENFDAYDVEPLSVPDVFSERPVLIYGKYHGTPTGSIVLKGTTGEGDYINRIAVNTARSSESNAALRYLWARERIRMLSDYASAGFGGKESEPAVTALGLKYNLLTEYTSFLAIDSEIRNTEGNSTAVSQPLPLPEGVSNQAVGGNLLTACCVKKSEYRSTTEGNTAVDYSVEEDEVSYIEGIKVEAKEKENNVFVMVEQMPEFVGGQSALEAFLKSNLVYPAKAFNSGISGIVYVSFVVDEKGNITKVKVLHGFDALCDKEALRVIKLTSGKWKPGTQSGKTVKVQMTFPVKFDLGK